MDEQRVKQPPSQNINQQESTPIAPTGEDVQKFNHTGLPKTIKTFVEAASGTFLDKVKVHYSSPRA
ncbi:MAG: hypothetical protein ACRBFS_16705 [Aureispira sp.]